MRHLTTIIVAIMLMLSIVSLLPEPAEASPERIKGHRSILVPSVVIVDKFPKKGDILEIDWVLPKLQCKFDAKVSSFDSWRKLATCHIEKVSAGCKGLFAVCEDKIFLLAEPAKKMALKAYSPRDLTVPPPIGEEITLDVPFDDIISFEDQITLPTGETATLDIISSILLSVVVDSTAYENFFTFTVTRFQTALSSFLFQGIPTGTNNIKLDPDDESFGFLNTSTGDFSWYLFGIMSNTLFELDFSTYFEGEYSKDTDILEVHGRGAFAPSAPSGVGGIVETPQIEEPRTVTPDLLGHNYGALAGTIAGAIAGGTALISVLWYIRKRRTKAT